MHRFVLLFLFISLSVLAQDKTKVIYILTDDLGYGDLSCYGQKKFQTPNIDRLATEGMKFSQHYSGSTVCAPSRCSLMTGLHTGNSQVQSNREVKPEGQKAMRADTLSIPRVLRKAGYISGMFGKWGLGSPGSVSDPMQHFDEFYGYNCQRQSHSFYPTHLWHNNEKVPLDGKTYSHDLIIKNAFDFIRKNKDEKFFCYLSVTIPHAAMDAPQPLHEKWKKLYPQFNELSSRYGNHTVTNPVAAFPAMMEHLDNGVGELMALLKELKIDDDTLVIFTSDNGAHKEGGHKPEFWDSNGPLRGLKRDLYEGGVRAPMIARWPNKIKAGSHSNHISAFWDVMPTLAELAGLNVAKTDGISFLPALLADAGQQEAQHEFLYWQFKNKKAIRKGPYKLIKIRDHYELYNLDKDLGEEKNLAKEMPEKLAELKALLKKAI